MKPTVRWRHVGDDGQNWMCWEINGGRIIVHDPKYIRKGKQETSLDDRVLSILRMAERRRKKGTPHEHDEARFR